MLKKHNNISRLKQKNMFYIYNDCLQLTQLTIINANNA